MSARARINPDRLPVLVASLVVLAAIAAAAFTLSFAGLSAVAPWAAVPPVLAWLVPVFVELAILGYVLAAYVHHARGESARGPWAWAWLWTLVSAGANGAHAWDAGPGAWQGLAGVALAALFPFATLIAAHVIARLVLEPAVEHDDPEPAPHPLEVLRSIETYPIRPGALDELAQRRAQTPRTARRTAPTTDEQRDTVRQLRAEGLSVRAIAARVGLSKSTVHGIVQEAHA